MKGRMMFITGIKRKKNASYIIKRDVSSHITSLYEYVVKKYGAEYTTCYLNVSTVYDPEKLPKELKMIKVTTISQLHLLFSKTDENDIKIS